MLNRSAEDELAKAVAAEADFYRTMQGAGDDSHVTQLLYAAATPSATHAAGTSVLTRLHIGLPIDVPPWPRART